MKRVEGWLNIGRRKRVAGQSKPIRRPCGLVNAWKRNRSHEEEVSQPGQTMHPSKLPRKLTLSLGGCRAGTVVVETAAHEWSRDLNAGACSFATASGHVRLIRRLQISFAYLPIYSKSGL